MTIEIDGISYGLACTGYAMKSIMPLLDNNLANIEKRFQEEPFKYVVEMALSLNEAYEIKAIHKAKKKGLEHEPHYLVREDLEDLNIGDINYLGTKIVEVISRDSEQSVFAKPKKKEAVRDEQTVSE